jgi:hypothetical protein
MVDQSTAGSLVLATVALYFLLEQLSYQRKKGPLTGPALVVPFLGSVQCRWSMIRRGSERGEGGTSKGVWPGAFFKGRLARVQL